MCDIRTRIRVIRLKNVCKNFDDLEVLKDVNITINDGEIYGIIGQLLHDGRETIKKE